MRFLFYQVNEKVFADERRWKISRILFRLTSVCELFLSRTLNIFNNSLFTLLSQIATIHGTWSHWPYHESYSYHCLHCVTCNHGSMNRTCYSNMTQYPFWLWLCLRWVVVMLEVYLSSTLQCKCNKQLYIYFFFKYFYPGKFL